MCSRVIQLIQSIANFAEFNTYTCRVTPKAKLSRLWIENFDLMPTHARVPICHYSINQHILKNILII